MDTKKLYKYSILKYSQNYINSNILLVVFSLFKFIFIKRKEETTSKKIEEKLDNFIEKINEKIIKNEKKYINKDYSIDNFKNIFLFVKTQNVILAGDIIEGILIYIFSFAFHADQDQTFGKYLFSNLSIIKNPNNYDLADMFKKINLFRKNYII